MFLLGLGLVCYRRVSSIAELVLPQTPNRKSSAEDPHDALVIYPTESRGHEKSHIADNPQLLRMRRKNRLSTEPPTV